MSDDGDPTSLEESNAGSQVEQVDAFASDDVSKNDADGNVVEESERKKKQPDLIPYTLIMVRKANGVELTKPLTVLLDSGSNVTWINRKVLPKGCNPREVEATTGNTIAGKLSSNQMVTLTDLALPEFNKNVKLTYQDARVFNQPDCRYDVITGRDFLSSFKIVLDFDEHVVNIGEQEIPMRLYPQKKDIGGLYPSEALAIEVFEDELFGEDGFTTILESKYDAADLKSVVKECDHLTKEQQDKLLKVMEQFPTLFDGKLRKYTGGEVHLDIDPTVKPVQSRAYPVAHHNLELFKKELFRLVDVDVLEKAGRSEWISPTFIVPKKDNRIRWVSDFRALNKAIRRKVYPIPIISEVLKRRKGYKYLSKIDLSMMFYTFVLDKKSREKTTIATPFGLFRYKRLPMGTCISPDVGQEQIEKTLEGIDNVEKYIDDLAIFSNSYEEHMETLKLVFERLTKAGFAVNPLKCEWCVQETDFLGHWLTPTGIKPWKKKIQAILDMKRPEMIKQLRLFLGMATCCRDMWPRRSHILAPLTELIGTKKYIWDDRCENAFKQMKALVASDTLLVYPDHNKPFEIDTDASDYQLGGVIKQDGKPVAFYSRKLNSAQKNYTTIEKELLSVVETLREFRTMLWGSEIVVNTDHKNLTHRLSEYTTQRVTRWRLLLEEFGPTFKYKKGVDNTVADALSRVPTKEPWMKSGDATAAMQPRSDASEDDVFFLDEEMLECMMFHPEPLPENHFPFQFRSLRLKQKEDQFLLQMLKRKPNEYKIRKLGDNDIIVRIVGDKDDDWRIVIPTPMVHDIVAYYHEISGHSLGIDRLFHTISRLYWHPDLRKKITNHVRKCDVCQRVKPGHKNIGQLAPRDAPLMPWEEVHVDSIGNWKAKFKGKIEINFNALTCVDPVTNLVEIVYQPDKTSRTTADLFANTWLARYPRPTKVVSDNGPEFKGEFAAYLRNAGIDHKTTTPHTAQANAVIESVHMTIGNVIRVLTDKYRPQTKEEAERLCHRALAHAMYATRCAAHSSLNYFTPGAIAFKRDMFLNIPLFADIITLRDLRQSQIDERLLRENAKRTKHEYKVNDMVYHERPAWSKAKMRYAGPHKIVQVHTNNTVTFEHGDLTERISIRRLKPARQ